MNDFVQFALERLAPLGELRSRAMFGGYGIYIGDTIFAIIVDDVLYLKADDATCGRFAVQGLEPFTYVAQGKTVAMKYYEAPPEMFEDMQVMQSWGQEAIGVALKAKKKAGEKKKSRY